MKKFCLSDKGFTLIELMIVITIIAIIMAIAIPSIIKSRTEGMKEKYPEFKNSEAIMIYEEDGYVVEEFEAHKIFTDIKTKLKYRETDSNRILLSDDKEVEEAEEGQKKELEKEDKDRVRREQDEWDSQDKSW